MARERTDGTSKGSQSAAYVMPGRSRAMLWASVAAAGMLALAMVSAYFAGATRTLSPGNVASQHARIDLKCAQCHEAGNEVTEVRCERCHDPVGSARLTHAAHVLIGTGDRQAFEAATATEQPCQTCHVEHRGVSASLGAVDDRECGSCHLFSTLARHPEFAAVRAQATPGVGLNFTHDSHLQKWLLDPQYPRGARCEVCHEQTPDRRGFQSITFERGCSGSVCHESNGLLLRSDLEPMPADLLVLPPRGTSGPQIQVDADLIQVSRLRHRDDWILSNALRLRRSVDAEGAEAERLTLQARIAYLEQLQRARPVAGVPAGDLQSAIGVLQREIADIDARLARPASAEADVAALEELTKTTRTLAGALQGLDPGLGGQLRSLDAAPTAAASPSPAASLSEAPAVLDRRKTELLALLEAIAARATDDAVRERVAALRGQVESLELASTGADADRTALLSRLGALDAAFRAVASVPDPGVQGELASIDLLRRYALQRVGDGVSPTDFEPRRRELLSLLDAIDRRGNEAVRQRAAGLRQRVIGLRPGSSGDAELRSTRRQRQRQLGRLQLELELIQSPAEYEPAPVQDATVDRASISALLQRLRADVAALDRAAQLPALANPDEAAVRGTLDMLLGTRTGRTGTVCRKCHELDPAGLRLAPVRIAEPVMSRSVFNHAPHVTQTRCETCHGSIPKSTKATDVNVPGVAVCVTCHAPSKASAECETCHIYHPASPARFVSLTP